MRKRTLLLLTALIILLLILLLPIKITCGIPDGSCATPPVDNTYNASYYYEIEPAGVALIELMTRQNSGVQYSTGTDYK
jgi:hypothetical protein